MSRTYKDRPARVRFPESYTWEFGTEKIPYETKRLSYTDPNDWVDVTRYWYKEIPGYKTKKRKDVDCEWHWIGSTPSWWTRMMMNRPQRRAAHLWEQEASHTLPEQLDELDTPNVSHKPHIYYY